MFCNHSHMNFLENVFGDILDTILGHLTDQRSLALHMTSKKMCSFTQKKIRRSNAFYLGFATQAIVDRNFELFEWAYSMKCPIDSNTIFHLAETKEFGILKKIITSGFKIDERMLGFITRTCDPELLEWLKVNDHISPERATEIFIDFCNLVFTQAVNNENIGVLMWLRQNAYFWNIHTSNQAAIAGNIPALKWVVENGCPLCPSIYAHVPEDINLLTYLIDRGAPISPTACAVAALKKKYDTLKWLRSRNCPWDSFTCAYLAMNGELELLKWARANDCPWGPVVCALAASRGQLEILRWCLRNGCPIDFRTVTFACDCGYFDTAKWIIDNGYPVNDRICSIVADSCRMTLPLMMMYGGGQYLDANDVIRGDCDKIEMLIWLHKRGYRAHKSIYDIAALQNDIDLAKWARDAGYEWSEHTTKIAASHGCLDFAMWARDNGCPWSQGTCCSAADGDKFEFLMWAHQNGCPMDDNVCAEAAKNGNLEMLMWARENGCPWNETAAEAAAEGGHLKILKWLIENGCRSGRAAFVAANHKHFDVMKWALLNGCDCGGNLLDTVTMLAPVDVVKWVIDHCYKQGHIRRMGHNTYTDLATWGEQHGYIFSEWDAKTEGGCFSKYVPEGKYSESKIYVLATKNAARMKDFVMQKANHDLRVLEAALTNMTDIRDIEKVADEYFNLCPNTHDHNVD